MDQGGQGQSLERLIVPDACVLLKWVLPAEREPDLHQARALRRAFEEQGIDLLLPPLWFYEVGNVLTLKCPEDAAARLRLLTDMAIPEARPSAAWREEICALVKSKRVTFYDATYHALARVTSGLFVTADRKYMAKVGGDAHSILLSDWLI